jgi:hypothetical protein
MGKQTQTEGPLKEIYKSFEIDMKANGEWQAEIRIIPNARGIDSIVPVFGRYIDRRTHTIVSYASASSVKTTFR